MIECEQCFPPILQSNFFLAYTLNHKTVSEYSRGFQTKGPWEISVKKSVKTIVLYIFVYDYI